MKQQSVKTHYGIAPSTTVDFFDVPIHGDVEAFICPFLIANNREKKLVDTVYNQLTTFLTNNLNSTS